MSGGLEQRGTTKHEEQRGTAKHDDMGVDCGCGQHWKVSLAVVCFVLGALCAVQQGAGGMRGMCSSP